MPNPPQQPQNPPNYVPLQPGQAPTYGTSGQAVLQYQQQLNQQNAGQPGWTPLEEDGLYGPLTQAASQYQPPANQNTQNQNTQNQNNQNQNTQTEPATPAPTQAETDLAAANNAYQTEATNVQNTITGIQNGTVPLSVGEQAQVDELKRQFQELIEQQKITNVGASGTANVRGYQTGAAEYDPSFQVKTIGSIVTAGINKVASLNSQMVSAVAALTQSFKDNNIAKVKEAWNIYSEASKKRSEELTKTVDAAKKVADEARKQKEAADKDVAIADEYSSGTTDVPSILAALKKKGITATSKEVADALKNTGVEDIQKIIDTASKNGASFAQIHELSKAKTPAEASAIMAKYGLGQSEADKLDMVYKKAQIAKIYDEINTSGIKGVDASQLIAYANEYAATGKIPTGMPKGTFGIISQAAKELPKQQGQIVATSTGVSPSNNDTLVNAMGALSSATELAKQLKELDKQRVGGLVSGTLGKVFGSEDQQRYVDLRGQIVDLLARARSGAALTESEEKRYSNMLPSRFSEPLGLGVNSDVRIENFINNLTADLTNKANTQGWTVYGVSKVKTPLGMKTVGETITTPNGLTGRINPDGTITLL